MYTLPTLTQWALGVPAAPSLAKPEAVGGPPYPHQGEHNPLIGQPPRTGLADLSGVRRASRKRPCSVQKGNWSLAQIGLESLIWGLAGNWGPPPQSRQASPSGIFHRSGRCGGRDWPLLSPGHTRQRVIAVRPVASLWGLRT